MLIYCITNKINDKKYVGLTTGSLKKRWAEHRSTKPDRQLIHKALHKYGEENFEIKILEESSDLESLNLAEIKWIKELNTVNPDGYNLSLGGNGIGKHSPETIKKIRESNIGKKHPPSSEERRAKARENSRGKRHTDETKIKMSKARDPTKKKVRDQHGNIYESVADCARILNIDRRSIKRVIKGDLLETRGYRFIFY